MLRAIALLLMIWAPCVYASGIGLPYPTTNEPPTTNAPPTTGENGCFYEGKWHPPGEIARGYDGRNWCYGVVCDPQGEVIHWDDFKCGTSSTPEYPTTFPRLEQTTPRMRANSPENRETPQTKTEWHGQDLKTSGKSAWPELDPTPTNIPKGCYHNGKWFPPGSRMTTERRGRRCFGTLCSHDGYVVTWDELFCGPELRPITTLSPPTRIPKGWLRRTRKPKSSRVPYGRDLIQPRYTRQPVTTRATRPSPVVKPCFYKGKFYVRGMNVMGSYPIDCKGLRCSLDGKLVKWDYCHDTTPPATPPWPTTPPGCHFHGKWYPPGSEISMSSYGECESGLTCDASGMIMVWDGLGCFRDPNPNVHTTDAPKHTTEPPRTTPEPTTEPPQTTPEPTTEPSRTTPELTTEPSRTTVEPTTEHITNVPRTPGCLYEGKWYPPGNHQTGYDGRDWCYGIMCDRSGQYVPWDNVNCGPTTTSVPRTTPKGCYHQGKWYPPGSEISRNSYGGCESGLTCGKDGMVIAWDGLGCFRDLRPSKTPTTEPQRPETTTKRKTQRRFTTIKVTRRPEDRPRSTRSPDTRPRTTRLPDFLAILMSTALPRYGCYENDRWYRPGAEISRGQSGSWCYGTYCSESGEVIAWDDWNCKTTARRTTKPSKEPAIPTTEPIPKRDRVTPEPTTTPGCHYHGKWYPPGSEISRSSYGGCESGLTCDESGMIMAWDGLGCFKDPNPNVHTTDALKPTTEPPRTTPEPTTEPPRTTPEPTTEPSRTTPELTTEPTRTTVEPTTEHVTNVPRTPGCLYEGKWYPPGNHQTGYDGRDWCYGIICDRSGQYVPWDNVNCGPTTTSVPRTTPKGCYHQGKWYPPGSEISRNSYGGCESGLTCGKDGMVIAWDGLGCFRDLRPSKTPTTEPQRPETTTKRKTQRRFTTIKVTRRPEDRPRSTRSPDTRPRTTRLPDFLAILMSTALPRYGCYENDRWYRPGAEISRGQSGSWCYGTYCSESGEVIAWDDWNCKTTARRTTEPSKEPAIPTTEPIPKRDRVTPEPTTTPGCHYHGKWYPPGSEISRSSYGGCESGLTCDESGMIMAWDGLGCFKDPNPNVHTTDALKPTTEPPRTTPEPTTEPPRTTPEPTTEPSRTKPEPTTEPPRTTSEPTTEPLRTTPEPTTEPSRTKPEPTTEAPRTTSEPTTEPLRTTPEPTTEPTTEHVTTVPRRRGCLYEGKWYPPGNHQTGYDGRDWCYGIMCDRSGQYEPWDNFNCGPETTVPQTSAKRSTTTAPTTNDKQHSRTDSRKSTTDMRGQTPRQQSYECYYEGKWFAPGSEIYRSSNGHNWCFGARCSYDGNVIMWDDFNCEHHLTRLALKIHRNRKSHPLNCYYRGRMYQTGNKIIHRSKNGKCYRAICAGGKIANWRSAVCPSVEVRLRPQMYGRSFVTTDSCQYKGKRYSVGSVVFSRALFRSRDHGWCVGLKCGGNGRIVTWGPQWGGC
ncbi:mucin-2 isoform X2 [Nematostella vectensis]|uniref:mucin-2 isoform X2 n=1 Tax=Nematostella vectensis TaxID=45351 RepID=UPI00207739FF|nr:mucin-2 isoform X2 [Nematostella vectensis]